MRYFVKLMTLLVLVFISSAALSQTVSVLPNAMTQFVDGNGAPYAGGHVYMYVPGTTTPKATYQTPQGTSPNANPITLDANGRAVIWGAGEYRQVLQDVYGVVQWDQLTYTPPTNTTGSPQSVWYGTATGTANVITLGNQSGFTGVDGQMIGFVASVNNSSTTTINASAYGSVLVEKTTAGGLTPLVGGEIIAGNIVQAIYSASANAFVLQTYPVGLGYSTANQLTFDAKGVRAQGRLDATTTVADVTYVTPGFCDYPTLTGTTDNTGCVQAAINYACAEANSSTTNSAGKVMFARGLYYIKTGLTIPQSCSGLELEGQGYGNPTSVNVGADGTFIVSDNNCTGPVVNFYYDATANYIYGGGISNIGFWNNLLTGGSPYGANSCLQPLIQVNHAQVFFARDLYAWQPYQFLKEIGGLFYNNERIYLDEALQDSPGEFEFTGWGAHPDATGQATRQDQVLLANTMMFANTTPQSGHMLPVGIWWHGFSSSFKTFNTVMEYASVALKNDCTTTGIAAAEIGACTAFGKFYDFETEGANGGSGALISMTDTQNNDFYQLYAAAFAAGSTGTGLLGGSGFVVKINNTLFHQTGVIGIHGGQLNGAGASGIDCECYELTVDTGTHIWGNNATAVGGSEITLEVPVPANTAGSHSIIGNDFCAAPSATGDAQVAINSITGVSSAVTAASGTGGVNGPGVYTVAGGACTTQPTLNVTWATGVMTVNSVATTGACTTLPGSPAALTYLSGIATGWTGATATLATAQDFNIVSGNNFRGCSSGIGGSLGLHGVNTPNAGP